MKETEAGSRDACEEEMERSGEVSLETDVMVPSSSVCHSSQSLPCHSWKEEKSAKSFQFNRWWRNVGDTQEQALLLDGLCLGHMGAMYNTPAQASDHTGGPWLVLGPCFREARYVAMELDSPLHDSSAGGKALTHGFLPWKYTVCAKKGWKRLRCGKIQNSHSDS